MKKHGGAKRQVGAMQGCRRAMTLTEVLLSMMLIGLLLTGVWRMRDSRNHAFQAIKNANVALFALESLRNRIVRDLSIDFTYRPELVAGYVAEMRVPFPITTREEMEGSRRILVLEMIIPPTTGRPGQRCLREVVLP
jgi:prepilin-type N-terminal cleavage/methylation domain-containing protein